MRLINLAMESGSYGLVRNCEAVFDCLTDDEIKILSSGTDKLYKPIEMSKTIKYKKSKNNIKVIFNNPATILIIDGKKYVSKAHKEEFDEEKGLLMCLAKANGISHLELKRMIKNAKGVINAK